MSPPDDRTPEILPPEEPCPIVLLRYRHDGWVPGLQREFLAALGEMGCVRDACRRIKRSSTSAYRLRERSPEFAAAWDRALEMAGTVLEHVAFQRAVIGIMEPIHYHGKLLGYRRRYSDSLLRMLTLRGRLRDEFGGELGRGAARTQAQLVKQAHAAARAAGGYFDTPASVAETNAALLKKLDALGRQRQLSDERQSKV